MFKLKKSNLSRNIALRNASPGYAFALNVEGVVRFGLPCTHIMFHIPSISTATYEPHLHHSYIQNVCMEAQAPRPS